MEMDPLEGWKRAIRVAKNDEERERFAKRHLCKIAISSNLTDEIIGKLVELGFPASVEEVARRWVFLLFEEPEIFEEELKEMNASFRSSSRKSSGGVAPPPAGHIPTMSEGLRVEPKFAASGIQIESPITQQLRTKPEDNAIRTDSMLLETLSTKAGDMIQTESMLLEPLSTKRGDSALPPEELGLKKVAATMKMIDMQRKEVVTKGVAVVPNKKPVPEYPGVVVEKFMVSSGQADVYKGIFPAINNMDVAVKVMHGDSFSSYEEESKALLQLRHDNIVRVCALFAEPIPAIVTEWMDGGALHTWLNKRFVQKNRKAAPWDSETEKIALGIAAGLEYLHKKGIVHRDLKSPNVLLGKDNHPVLIDFGMAKGGVGTRSGSLNQQLASYQLGSVIWMSPEMISKKTFSAASDVYAFGIILWELLACKLPYETYRVEFELQQDVVSGKRPPIDKSWPQTVVSVMVKCWGLDPCKRPKAKAVVDELSSYAKGRSYFTEMTHETELLSAARMSTLETSNSVRESFSFGRVLNLGASKSGRSLPTGNFLCKIYGINGCVILKNCGIFPSSENGAIPAVFELSPNHNNTTYYLSVVFEKTKLFWWCPGPDDNRVLLNDVGNEFDLIEQKDGRFAFFACSLKQFVCSEKRGLFVNRKEVKEWEIFSLEIVKESMVLILEPEFSYTVAFKAQLLKACKDYKNAVSLKKAKPIGSNLLIGKKDLIWEFIPQRDVRSLKIRNLAVNKYLEVKRSGEIHLTSRPKNDLWSTFQIFGDHDGTVMIVALGTNLLVGLCIDWEGVESLRADSPKKTVDESFFLLRET